MFKLLNFILTSKPSENKIFYRFYILQLLIFTASLSRGTAIGFVLYKLGVEPQELGLTASIAMGGMLIGYWATPHLQKLLKNSYLVFKLSQYALALNYFLLMIYISECMYHNYWGNYWFWTAMGTIISFFVSVEQYSRPLFVKDSFPHINFSKIIKQDVMTMGIAKIIGFSTGVIIVSSLWVFYIFLYGFLISLIMIYYIGKISKKNDIILFQKTSIVKIKKERKVDYITTIALHIINCLILFPINTQAITYAKVWNIPFYWFYISGAFGNVFFNIFVNKLSGTDLGKYYLIYVACLVLGFSLFLTSGYWVLLGSFFVGASYSSLSILSSSRLYEGTFKGSNKSISRFYIMGCIGCIIGSYVLGFFLNKLDKNVVFTFLIVFTIVTYGLLALFTKKTNRY